jgi:hypothetical protein
VKTSDSCAPQRAFKCRAGGLPLGRAYHCTLLPAIPASPANIPRSISKVRRYREGLNPSAYRPAQFPQAESLRVRDPHRLSNVCTSITPCPRAAGTPTGRSPFSAQYNPGNTNLPIGCERNAIQQKCALRLNGKDRFVSSFRGIAWQIDRLTPAAHRPVTRQRTRPHPQTRRQRRRNSTQRTAALAATFLRRFFHAHPVPARGTLRIQTLHSPSRKLHFTSRRVKFGPLRKRGNCMPLRLKKSGAPVKLAGLCAHAFSVSRKMSAISCGPLPIQISPEMDRVEGRFGNIRKIVSVRAVLLRESL